MQSIVKVELKKLVQVDFIRAIETKNWLSYIFLVKKKRRNKFKVFVDYWNLNKFIRRDYFLLSFIIFIINSVIGHNLYNFVDGFFDYNQVSIAI